MIKNIDTLAESFHIKAPFSSNCKFNPLAGTTRPRTSSIFLQTLVDTGRERVKQTIITRVQHFVPSFDNFYRLNEKIAILLG